ncbi:MULTISPECIES: hypothetical protein [unclassified Lentimicrobium]|uniref:hypothetical protein n=1 Tax=unclassified Lentimicrobium TaxID=2677434 RepID=UPI00155571CC|nr:MULTISPECIES: hypothetical protein [unclassified Lentimicrobium]NPD47375.1 hypothetical protein [Lentimicrobium sp. S6]NPD86811.1 hypothetical protein [Lentimicrobium sp. L6]
MNEIEAFLNKNYGKVHALDLAEVLSRQPERIPELLKIILKEEEPISRRGAWYFSTLFDKYPHLVIPYVDELISNLENIKSQAILRCFLRTISRVEIAEPYHAYLIQYSADAIMSNKSEIAVKAMAMDIFFQIAKFQPELFNELEYMIELIYPDGSRGIQNKCRKMIKYIEKTRSGNTKRK